MLNFSPPTTLFIDCFICLKKFLTILIIKLAIFVQLLESTNIVLIERVTFLVLLIVPLYLLMCWLIYIYIICVRHIGMLTYRQTFENPYVSNINGNKCLMITMASEFEFGIVI